MGKIYLIEPERPRASAAREPTAKGSWWHAGFSTRRLWALSTAFVATGSLLFGAARWNDRASSTADARLPVAATKPLKSLDADVASQFQRANKDARRPAGLMIKAQGDVPPSARLQAELKSSTDWRVFAMAAMSRPAEGGYFYAMQVLSLCRRSISASPEFASSTVAEAVRTHGTVSAEQVEVARRFSGLCASFTPHEADTLLESIKDKAGDGSDPLVNASRAMRVASESHDPAAVGEALHRVLQSRDPLLLSSDMLLPRAMLYEAGSQKAAGGLWFDGSSYSLTGAGSNTLLPAVALATCRNDAVCDLDDKMAVGCLRGGDCSQDHGVWIRNQYLAAGYTQEQFESAVLPLAERVRAKLEAADAQAFLGR